METDWTVTALHDLSLNKIDLGNAKLYTFLGCFIKISHHSFSFLHPALWQVSWFFYIYLSLYKLQQLLWI